MHDLLRIGNIGFAPEELPRLEPYLPSPVGLALGGANVGTVIDLLPRRKSAGSKSRLRLDRRAVFAAAAAVVLLGAGTYKAHGDQTSAESKKATAEAAVTELRSKLYYAQQGPAQSGGAGTVSVAALKSQVKNVLAQDVAWPAILANIGLKLPPGVSLTSFTGTHTVVAATSAAVTAPTTATNGATGTGSAPAAATAGTSATPPAVVAPADICAGVVPPSGTVSMSGTATSLPAVAALLDSLKKDTDLSVLWVTTANATDQSITFTVSASLGSTARGHRLETLFKGAKCK